MQYDPTTVDLPYSFLAANPVSSELVSDHVSGIVSPAPFQHPESSALDLPV
jgi:hypothetical protein